MKRILLIGLSIWMLFTVCVNAQSELNQNLTLLPQRTPSDLVNTSPAVKTVTARIPGGVTGRMTAQFDIKMPSFEVGEEEKRSYYLYFQGHEKTNPSSNDKPNRANISNMGTHWVMYLIDAKGADKAFGGNLDCDKWYTLRFEIDVREHYYNAYLIDTETGAILTKDRNRRTNDTANVPTAKLADYFYEFIQFTVNTSNKDPGLNFEIANAWVEKQSVWLVEKPEITVGDGIVTAKAMLANDSTMEIGAENSPVLLLTVFDEENRPVTMACQTARIKAKTHDLHGDMSISRVEIRQAVECTAEANLKPGWRAEAVVLDSFVSRLPLCSAVREQGE